MSAPNRSGSATVYAELRKRLISELIEFVKALKIENVWHLTRVNKTKTSYVII